MWNIFVSIFQFLIVWMWEDKVFNSFDFFFYHMFASCFRINLSVFVHRIVTFRNDFSISPSFSNVLVGDSKTYLESCFVKKTSRQKCHVANWASEDNVWLNLMFPRRCLVHHSPAEWRNFLVVAKCRKDPNTKWLFIHYKLKPNFYTVFLT